MDFENKNPSSSHQLGRVTDRLALYQHQLNNNPSTTHSPRGPSSPENKPTISNPAAPMARDPITCHVLNTLTGTPAANLPVTLTLLSSSSASSNQNQSQSPVTFHATTDSDGRVKTWTPAAASTSTTVPGILSSLPTADSKTNWAIRFEVGPWYEAQGVESFWPEVEVKFTVKGRGREGEEGWRHYHVPVLLGPWNYSTYRGS